MEQLEIFVESLTGSLLQFQVSPFETVLSLKEKIQNLQGIPVNHQHLIHQDRELDNDLSLYNYNIQNGSTLRLILHMRGGPISTRPLTADLTQQTLLEEMATEYMESLTGENWPPSGADGGGSVASGVSGDSETQTDARAPSTASASPTPVPPSSQPHPRHVTLLVLRDGDQLNFYRVVDRSTSMVVPNGGGGSNGGVIAPYDAPVSPSASAIGDDQSSAASEATLNGSASGLEASMQSFSTSKENNRSLIYDQHLIEDRTRQKMAELRSRMMANNKQVQIHNNGAAVASGLNTTPVLMPRPPSTTTVQRANISRNSMIQDFSGRPYAPSAMSSLRRRRLPSQSVPIVPGSPPKGTVNSSSPPEHGSSSSSGGDDGSTNVSSNNFASLADYFRSKEENVQQPEKDSSPSPLPSPLHKRQPQIQTASETRRFSGQQQQQTQQQDIVRCSPYLRELFSGAHFFGGNQQQDQSQKDVVVTQQQQQSPPKSSPMQLKPVSKPVVDPGYEHLVGESVVQRGVPSRTSSRLTQQQSTPTRPSGLANAFAALIEHQTIQPPPPPPPPIKKPMMAPYGGGMARTQPNTHNNNNNNHTMSDPDEDVDVLEHALTTLLFKAELEHLGSSRLPVGLIQPPVAGNSGGGDMTIKDSRTTAAGVGNRHMATQPSSSTRFGGAATNYATNSNASSTTFSRQQHPIAGGNTLTNRVPTTYSKFLSSTSNSTSEVKKSFLDSTTGNSMATTKLPAIASSQPPQIRAPAAPVAATRCAVCNRRTGLATTYVCRCSATFCTVHRYPEAHQCTYDYKGEGRRAIQANNPVITADKLPKI